MKTNNKLKGLIIAGAVFLVLMVIVAISIIMKPNTNDNYIQIPKDELNIADLLIATTENSLNLINLDGEVLVTIENANNLKSNVDLNEYLYVKNNSIYGYEVVENKSETEEGTHITYGLTENEIINNNNQISDFMFNDNYIVYLTNKMEYVEENNVNEIETNKEDSLTTEIPKFAEYSYTVNVYDRVNNKTKVAGMFPIDYFTVLNDNIYYSSGNYLYIYNINTEELSNIYLGKDIEGLNVINNKLIVFSSFGNDNGKSLVLQLNNNLIEKASKHDGVNITPIISDEKGQIVFIDSTNKPILYMLNLDGERETNAKLNLNVNFDLAETNYYNYNNAVYSQGFLYTTLNNRIDIIDMNSATVHKTIDLDINKVYPIYKNVTEEIKTEQVIE